MCPECNRNPHRKGPLQGTADDWRTSLLDRLARFETEGVDCVEWSTARDKHVCSLCAVRDGRTFTPAELRAEIAAEFCRPGDPDDRCRCTLLPVL